MTGEWLCQRGAAYVLYDYGPLVSTLDVNAPAKSALSIHHVKVRRDEPSPRYMDY